MSDSGMGADRVNKQLIITTLCVCALALVALVFVRAQSGQAIPEVADRTLFAIIGGLFGLLGRTSAVGESSAQVLAGGPTTVETKPEPKSLQSKGGGP